jgi:hypothetical protein
MYNEKYAFTNNIIRLFAGMENRHTLVVVKKLKCFLFWEVNNKYITLDIKNYTNYLNNERKHEHEQQYKCCGWW